MANSNLLDTSAPTYLELIGNGRLYIVPPYQRDYSWTEEQWEDLWRDIETLSNDVRHRDPEGQSVESDPSEDEKHYMGALVVEARSDREFLVIDGQQRLATLSLLTLAVIDRLQTLAALGIDSDANMQRARALRARYIGEADPASLVESSKLSLNAVDDDFYQTHLVQLRSPPNPRRLPRSNRLLWNCFEYFRGSVAAWKNSTTDGLAIAQLISETVGRRLLFIRIAVDDDLNAYKVFETLNARGLELSATDLLKNYLFSRLHSPLERDLLSRRWKSLMAIVGQERFPEFLRYHLQCEVSRVRTRRLFKLVRERVKDAQQTFELMVALERRAEVFDAIFDPNHGHWIDRAENRSLVRELSVLRARQMTPLVFAAWERFEPDAFCKLLKLLVAVLFRYSTIARSNSNRLELVFHQAAKGVLDATLRTPADVFAALRPIHIDDRRFRQEFMLYVPDSDGQTTKLIRYILAKLESDASGRACDPDTDPGSIEHILPINPSEAWDASFAPASQDQWIDRLGNMTWLEKPLNRAVGNAAIDDKLEAYARSRYAMTNSIPDEIGGEWTPAKLEARQARMAERAAHLWRVDFS